MIIVGLEDVRKKENSLLEEDTTSDITDVDEQSTTLHTSSQEQSAIESKPNMLISLLNGNQRPKRVVENTNICESVDASMQPSETFQNPKALLTESVLIMSILNGNRQKEEPVEKNDNSTTNTDTLSINLPLPSQSSMTLNDTGGSSMLMSVLNGNKKVPKISEHVEQNVPKVAPNTKTLEDMVYSKVKSTTVKDLLATYNKKFDGKVVIRLPPAHLQKLQSELVDHETSSDPMGCRSNKELESRIFSRAKLLSARDIFNNFKRKSDNTNPLSLKVTLKVDRKKLAKVSYFVTKGNNSNGKSCKNLFSEMMTASRNVKMTPLQKAKKLNPPYMNKSEFHVFDGSWDKVELKARKNVHLEDHFGPVPALQREVEPECYIYETKEVNKKEYALKKLPCLQKTAPLNAIFDLLDNDSGKQLWVDKFRPKSTQDLLMHRQNIELITNWIKDSFGKIQTQAPVKNLNRKLKKRRLDSFIVYEDTEEEFSLPFLIIQGSSGSGKSTAVYTAMKELDGYVHEINSGMARGRKDIYNNLKELSTTQLVHDTKDFKPGLIFFEDVNILFEQDKTFWLVVQDIINVSKRPIIITCEELWNIPKTLIDFAQEDDSIIFIDDRIVSRKLVVDYLWMCCLVEGFDVGDDILEQIVDEMWNGHNYDLRGCLMSCEIMCKKRLDQLVVIRKRADENSQVVSDLEEKAFHCELNSCGDVINSCLKSQIPQAAGDNELIDIYCVDDSQGYLPFELNIGNELQMISKNNQTLPAPKFTFNDLQFECQQFIGSRSKKLPIYYYQDFEKRATRSSSDIVEPTTGIPETSFIYNISPSPFILDLLPFTRVWQAFQTQLDIYETKTLNEEKLSLKKFLQYRDFQHKSTLNGTLQLG